MTFTLMVTVVRFHMRVTPFLDHAGAARKGCVKRTIEELIRSSWQHRPTVHACNRFRWPRVASRLDQPQPNIRRKLGVPGGHGPQVEAALLSDWQRTDRCGA